MEQLHSFGYWVRRRRKALDLTQQDLAGQVGCALGTLKKIEADERRPSKQLAERLATCLAIPNTERSAFLRAARAELTVDQMPAPTPAHSYHRLPIQPTVLIGRVQAVAAVCEQVQHPDVHLVTLTGPGGVGKTRLAIQAASELHDSFVDGVVYISLAPLADSALVVPRIAQTLGIQGSSSQLLLETLQDSLRERSMLLLLDNFEHLLDSAPLVADLLLAAPNLKVLVTSREVLRLRGEREFAVLPLDLPTTQANLSVAEVMESAAAQLFVARARDQQPDFMVTAATAPMLAAICTRLDGLPLAIELAATRVKLFTLAAILARLTSRLNLLTGGPRDLPLRQQMLRSTIDWSYDLLNPAEQRLFRCLGVFAGGWTLEDAQAVWSANPQQPGDTTKADEDTLAALMSSLLDKSLLRRSTVATSEPRFTMLETVREYALECLVKLGELDEMQHRHAEIFLQLAEQAEPELWGRQQVEWMQRLQHEHDNIRAALSWAQGNSGTYEIGARIAIALAWFWLWRGYRHEGTGYVRNALELEIQPTLVRARLLCALGMFALESEIAFAQPSFEESLALFRIHGARKGQADVLWGLGRMVVMAGRADAATQLFEDSLSLYRQIGDTIGVARVLGSMAELSTSEKQSEQSLALYRSVGHVRGQADALRDLGFTAHAANEFARAIALLKESESLFQQLQDDGGALWPSLVLGDVYFDTGQNALAAASAQANVDTARRINDRVALGFALQNLGKAELLHNHAPNLAYRAFAESIAVLQGLEFARGYGVWQGLIGQARVAAATGAAERTARWCAAVEALSTAQEHPPPEWTPEQYHCFLRALDAARQSLDQEAFDAAWNAGLTLTLDQVVAETFALRAHALNR